MSREQQTDLQTQTTTTPEAGAQSDVHGLPPALHQQVVRLRPGDADGLAQLLSLHRELSQAILAVASSHVGLSTVKQAMALSQGGAVGRGGALAPSEYGPGGEFELEGSAPAHPAVGRPGALKPSEYAPGGEFALEGSAPAAPAVGRPGALKPSEYAPGGEFALEGSAPAAPAVGRPGALKPSEYAPGGEFALEGSAPAPAVGRPGALKPSEYGPGGEFELEGSAPAKSAAPAVGRPGALKPSEYAPGGEFSLEGGPPSAQAVARAEATRDYRPGGQFELEGGAPAKAAAPAWVAGAQRYNAAHAELVSEFNEATQGACKGSDGELDAQAVARWQAQHGVEADGKVGPHTLAAARHAMAKAGPAGVSATGLASI